jgi:signal transduction histidine kinase
MNAAIRARVVELDEAAELLQTYRAEASSSEIDALLAELEGTRAELREFAHGIRPRALSSGGLAAALPALAARSPTPVALQVDTGRHPPAIESAIYFVCSEALANAAKHARAGRIDVAVVSVDGTVEAMIRDDGVGGADPRGSGLRGLADRIVALGGTLTIGDAEGGGTTIRARLPSRRGPSEVAP